MKFLIRVVVNALVLIAMAGMFPNLVFVQNFGVALLTGLILAILNSTIRPFLQLISLPVTVLSFGFFALIINAFMLELATHFVGNQVMIPSAWSVLLVSIVLSIVQSIVFNFLNRNFEL